MLACKVLDPRYYTTVGSMMLCARVWAFLLKGVLSTYQLALCSVVTKLQPN